jgi:hypothetical protein
MRPRYRRHAERGGGDAVRSTQVERKMTAAILQR